MTHSLLVVVRVPPPSSDPRERASDATLSSYSSDETSDEHDTSVTASALATATSSVGSKRKSSYNMQKDEMTKLRREAEALQATLSQLHAQRPPSRIRENEELRGRVMANSLAVASAQSLLANTTTLYESPPFGTAIHLPREPLDRLRVLRALKPTQIDDAARYMLARCQHTNLARAGRQIEHSSTDSGDQIALLWEIAHVTEGARPLTVRRVFNKLLAFTRIREMALADRLGRLNIRESDVEADATDVAQSRVLSTHPNGLHIEKNLVVHSQYFERSALLNAPFGLYVINSVDRDDAFPYQPQSRIREEVVSAMLILDGPTELRGVALAKYSFVRVCRSALATDEQLAVIAEDGLRSCFDVMIKVVRERLTDSSIQEEEEDEDEDPMAFIDSLLRDANTNA